jgi:hypothetical protein
MFYPVAVKDSTAGLTLQISRVVVRQIVVPLIKGIFSCLAQALRFGIAG